jgi:hypothetical protein
MYHDGLYITHGIEGHALVIVREDNGSSLWLRDFASVESALDVLDDDVLMQHKRSDIESSLSGKRGFYTAEYEKPEDGLRGCAFKKYVSASS